jgi:O-antigen/teichoic acid export membrane protein
MLTAVTTVLNAAVISMGRSWLQVVQNATASSTKLVAVWLPVGVGHLTTGGLTASELLGGWVGGLALSLVVCGPLAVRGSRRASREARENSVGLVKRYKLLALQHLVLNVSLSGSTLLLPFIASAVLVPAEVAYYATARLLVNGLLAVPYLLSVALFAVASSDVSSLRRRVRQTIMVGLVINVVIVVVIMVSAPLLLGLFGPQYAGHGAIVLRILILAGVPLLVIDHFIAVNRVRKRLAASAYWIAGGTALQLVAGLVGGLIAGLEGMCAGWVGALVCEAAMLSPTVYKAAGSSVMIRVGHGGAKHMLKAPGGRAHLLVEQEREDRD